MFEAKDNQNIHGYIAYPLENYARGIFGLSYEATKDSIFSADSIESGSFVEVMLYVLRKKLGIYKNLSDFIEECKPFLGKTLSNNDFEAVLSLYNQCKKMLNENEQD